MTLNIFCLILVSKPFLPLGMTNDNIGVMREWHENDKDVIRTDIDVDDYMDDFEDDLRERILEYLNLRETIDQLRENNPSNSKNLDADKKWKAESHRMTYPFFNDMPTSKKAIRPNYLSGQNSYYDASDIIRL